MCLMFLMFYVCLFTEIALVNHVLFNKDYYFYYYFLLRLIFRENREKYA